MGVFSTKGGIAYLELEDVLSPNFESSAPYKLLCRFLGMGVVDRSGTLEHGFQVDRIDCLDSVYTMTESDEDFSSLCDRRAEELFEVARKTDRGIDVLWSGGIDSTVALIALLLYSREHDEDERLRVLLSIDSISEYPEFFHNHIHEHLRWRPITRPLASCLAADAMIVTGELGDQLFGSGQLRNLVANGIAFLPWQTGFPLVAAQRGLDSQETSLLGEYIEPLVDACPLHIDTLFEFFWWLEFTLTWQAASLRIPVSQGVVAVERIASLIESTHHFYRTVPFQLWALFGRERESLTEWCEYKMAAKDYIYDFNHDDEYRDTKTKEPSLHRILHTIDTPVVGD